MNLIELNAIKGHLVKQLAQISAIPINCHSCERFSLGLCQEFKAPPPDDWVNGVVDCEFWVWDGVPF